MTPADEGCDRLLLLPQGVAEPVGRPARRERKLTAVAENIHLALAKVATAYSGRSSSWTR